jgi:hypothetical protein
LGFCVIAYFAQINRFSIVLIDKVLSLDLAHRKGDSVR